MNNDDFKSSKISRFLTLSSSLTKAGTKLAIDAAKNKAQTYIDKNHDLKNLSTKIKVTTEIVQTMGEMKGAMMKLGQMISISDDIILPKEITELFKNLQKSAPPMAKSEIQKVFIKNFNKLPEDIFLDFNYHSIAAASIGQVHQAKLPDGTLVAIKIQYPKIVEAIKNDFSNLHKIDTLVKLLIPGKPNIDTLIAELKTSLLEECDYLIEYEKMIFFKNAYKDLFPLITIPEVYRDFSTKEILTMEWVSGDSFEETLAYDQVTKNKLGQELYDCFLFSLWELGNLHTDPQNGNYLFHQDKIIMLDFGSTRQFGKEFLKLYCELFLSIENNLPQEYFRTTKSLDIFEDKEEESLMLKHFDIIVNLYKPFMTPGKSVIPDTNPLQFFKEFIKDIELSGRKSPRQEFLLLDRSTFGLYLKLKAWKSEIDWVEPRKRFRLSIEKEVKINYL
jgi:predicted unusual protein kinase regulating ubiquinone biosynthesis (AarF/ABC1/UbiB family)